MISDTDKLSLLIQYRRHLDCADALLLDTVILPQAIIEKGEYDERWHPEENEGWTPNFDIRDFKTRSALSAIWKRNNEKLPIIFAFDPIEKIPEIVDDEIAFMVWCSWRKGHLLGEHQDLNGSCLEIARYIREDLGKEGQTKLDFNGEERQKVVSKFNSMMDMLSLSSNELEYWEENIFSLLTGQRTFKWILDKDIVDIFAGIEWKKKIRLSKEAERKSPRAVAILKTQGKVV